MFSARELELMNKGKDMLAPSAKEVGKHANLSQDEKEKLKAERKAKAKDPDRVVYPRFPSHIQPYAKANREYAKMKKAAEKAHAEKQAKAAARQAEKQANKQAKDALNTPEERARIKQLKIDADIAKLNAPKKSQPLPDNPEDVKRKLPSIAARHYMDRYWDRQQD